MTVPTPKERAILMSRGGLSNDVISGVLGITLTDVEALMVQAQPDVEISGGVIQVETTVLNDEQIKALPTQEIELLPEVAGTFYALVAVVVVLHKPNGDAYTDLDAGLSLRIVGDDPDQPLAFYSGIEDMLGAALSQYLVMTPDRVTMVLDSSSIVVEVPGQITDLTGGAPANSMEVTLNYLTSTFIP